LIDCIGSRNVEKILDGKASAITTCGSGMTAGILWLGLQLLRAPKVALYDEVRLNSISYVRGCFMSPAVLDRLCYEIVKQDREKFAVTLNSPLAYLHNVPAGPLFHRQTLTWKHIKRSEPGVIQIFVCVSGLM
jgi:hypothetical protein